MTRPRRRSSGFTLLEMLVAMVVLGLVSTLLWQAVATLARIEERLTDSRLFADRDSLQGQWVRQALQGLMNGPRNDPLRFAGEAQMLVGYTTMPPWPRSLGPEAFELTLETEPEGRTRLQGGRPGSARRWTLMSWPGKGRFVYLDTDGTWIDRWPPVRSPTLPGLPRAIALEAGEGHSLVVACQSGENPMLRRLDIERGM